jgi:hypothetical protein
MYVLPMFYRMSHRQTTVAASWFARTVSSFGYTRTHRQMCPCTFHPTRHGLAPLRVWEPRVTRSVTATRQSKSATDGHKPPSRRRRPRSVRVPNRRHPRRNASSFPSPTNVPPGLRLGASDWATNGGPPQRRPRLRVFCFRSRHGAVPASPPPNRE